MYFFNFQTYHKQTLDGLSYQNYLKWQPIQILLKQGLITKDIIASIAEKVTTTTNNKSLSPNSLSFQAFKQMNEEIEIFVFDDINERDVDEDYDKFLQKKTFDEIIYERFQARKEQFNLTYSLHKPRSMNILLSEIKKEAEKEQSNDNKKHDQGMTRKSQKDYEDDEENENEIEDELHSGGKTSDPLFMALLQRMTMKELEKQQQKKQNSSLSPIPTPSVSPTLAPTVAPTSSPRLPIHSIEEDEPQPTTTNEEESESTFEIISDEELNEIYVEMKNKVSFTS